jgi:hypothetical protein
MFGKKNETQEDRAMIRVTHLFPGKAADQELGSYIRNTYLPLLEALPGMLRVEAAFVTDMPLGSMQVHAFVDQYFEDEDDMTAAMVSPAGRALSREIMANPRLAPEVFVGKTLNVER